MARTDGSLLGRFWGVRRPIKGGPGPLLGNGGRGRFGGKGGEGLIDQAEVDSAVDGTTGISTRARGAATDRPNNALCIEECGISDEVPHNFYW